ncbi:LLM class flavin-dependent oxidoreductase [Nonomuraea insulae]|uniref:LLM class flavin-dependent oxidoreductase n=1 Tax=Nonomuraea insulae TaxID=1616787 RepID=A0ABW1CQZ9_9ACTN
MNARPLRFHWSVPGSRTDVRGATARAGTSALPDAGLHVEFAQRAEEAGMDSVLVPIGHYRADPVTMAAVMGAETSQVRFMLAARPGIVSPTYFVQQVNTLALLTGGRVSINSVAGHSPAEQRFYGDTLSHDERYRRAEEFWTICHALWATEEPVDFDGDYYRLRGALPGVPFGGLRGRPEIYVGGNSEQAERVARTQADCHLRFAAAPDDLAAPATRMLESGTETGIVVSIVVRPTRDEAVRAAYELVERAGEQARRAQLQFTARSDSVGFAEAQTAAGREDDWLTPHLWNGAVPYLGPPAMSLVGAPGDIADGLAEFARAGISQFVFQGRPDLETMTAFGRDVLPLVRERESR